MKIIKGTIKYQIAKDKIPRITTKISKIIKNKTKKVLRKTPIALEIKFPKSVSR
jgi:hypothetical protein